MITLNIISYICKELHTVIKVLPACTVSLNFRGRQQVRKGLVGTLSAGTIRKESNDQFHHLGSSASSFQDYQYESCSDPISGSDPRSPPCYVQSSSMYIKNIYWLCNNAAATSA